MVPVRSRCQPATVEAAHPYPIASRGVNGKVRSAMACVCVNKCVDCGTAPDSNSRQETEIPLYWTLWQRSRTSSSVMGTIRPRPEWLQQVDAEAAETSFQNVTITIQAATPRRRTRTLPWLSRPLMPSGQPTRFPSTAARTVAHQTMADAGAVTNPPAFATAPSMVSRMVVDHR